MKVRKIFLLALCMIFLIMQGKTIVNAGIRIECNGHMLNIKSDDEQVVTIIAASYRNDNSLNNTEIWNDVKISSQELELDISDLMSDTNNQSVKFMVWESFDNMKPIEDAVTSKIATINVDETGCVMVSGYNTKAKSDFVPIMVKDEENNIVFVEQVIPDEKCNYNIRFNIKDFEPNKKYTLITSDLEREIYTFEYVQNLSIVASEDVGVINGTYSSTNFAETVNGISNDTILLKSNTQPGHDRKGYFKFDVSNVDIDLDKVDRVCFQYHWVISETSTESLALNLYEVNHSSWSESSLTYSTQELLKGNYIGKGTGMVNSTGMIDITDYVRDNFSDGVISFMAEGNYDTNKNQGIASREHENEAYRPQLVFYYDDNKIFNNYPETSYSPNVDPIDNAKKMIEGSAATYSYSPIVVPEYDDSEYTEKVNAKLKSSSEYTAYPTRILNSLHGFTSSEQQLDIYGGDATDNVVNGSGYFDVVKDSDGKWTLVDPLGNRFYSVGLTTVSPNYMDIINNYKNNLPLWVSDQSEFYKQYGFNSAGAWSFMFREYDKTNGTVIGSRLYFDGIKENSTTPVACLIPRGVAISYGKTINGVEDSGVEHFKGGVPPVFNPDFEEKCGEIIKEYTEDFKNSPNIIGWWSDNEIDDSLAMLDYALNLDPYNELYVYTHATAWEWLRDRLNRENVGLYDVNDTLREEFREFVYDRYYQVMKRQFAKHTPNHLYLGNRHWETSVKSRGVFAAAARYCDIISYNLYKYWTPNVVSEWGQYADVPVIVTEFYSDKETVEGGWLVEDEYSEGKFYENYMLRLIEANNVVGAHYQSFNAFNTKETPLHTSAKNINTNIYNLVDYFSN